MAPAAVHSSLFSFRFLVLALFALCAIAPTLGHARTHPIENVESAPIPQGIDPGKIENAIVMGGKQRGWLSKKVTDRHLEATINVRKHSATVDIKWTDAGYSITYKDSQNLKYKDGKIHSNYNIWVRNLNLDIQKSLTQTTL